MSRKSGVKEILYGAILFKGRYIAIGAHHRILSSTNTQTWKTESIPGTGEFLHGVTYGNGQFIAVSSSRLDIRSQHGDEGQFSL